MSSRMLSLQYGHAERPQQPNCMHSTSHELLVKTMSGGVYMGVYGHLTRHEHSSCLTEV